MVPAPPFRSVPTFLLTITLYYHLFCRHFSLLPLSALLVLGYPAFFFSLISTLASSSDFTHHENATTVKICSISPDALSCGWTLGPLSPQKGHVISFQCPPPSFLLPNLHFCFRFLSPIKSHHHPLRLTAKTSGLI